ncbi:MAG: thiamine biosynthesis protein ThiS [Gammaproteobacteria bacterium]|nr:MAG: thiamine biosynthesis protein ThiS [Gammaproteobacteria bacterium]
MTKLTFNGKNIDSKAKTLAELLIEQGFTADSHVATAVNGQFVAKTARADYALNDGDAIEVVAPMQGG